MSTETPEWSTGHLGIFTDEELLVARRTLGQPPAERLSGADEQTLAAAVEAGARSLFARGMLVWPEPTDAAADDLVDPSALEDLDDDDLLDPTGAEGGFVLLGAIAAVVNMQAGRTSALVVDVLTPFSAEVVVAVRDPQVPYVLVETVLDGGYRAFDLVEPGWFSSQVHRRLGDVRPSDAVTDVPDSVRRAADGSLDPGDLEWLDAGGGLVASIHVTASTEEGPSTLTFLVAGDSSVWVLGPSDASGAAPVSAFAAEATTALIDAMAESLG